MRPLLLVAFLTLAACGADGPPVAPNPEASLTITGEGAIGVSTKIN